jgi:hypothetical protein
MVPRTPGAVKPPSPGLPAPGRGRGPHPCFAAVERPGPEDSQPGSPPNVHSPAILKPRDSAENPILRCPDRCNLCCTAVHIGGLRAFSRTAPVTRRYIPDRHHLEATFDPAPVGLACWRPIGRWSGFSSRQASSDDTGTSRWHWRAICGQMRTFPAQSTRIRHLSPGDKAGTCPEVSGRAKTEVRPRSGKCDATWTGRGLGTGPALQLMAGRSAAGTRDRRSVVLVSEGDVVVRRGSASSAVQQRAQ